MRVKYAKSFSDRFLGLIKKSNPRFLMFKTRFGIHTFFLKESIDVLVLDDDFRVSGIKKSLKPNRLFFWNIRYQYVLELPNGEILKRKIKLGNKLNFDVIEDN